MISGFISNYLANNYNNASFTQEELKALKEGNTETLLDTFVKMENDLYMQQLKCVVNGIKMFIGEDIALQSIMRTDSYKDEFVACQIMDGDEDIVLGIGGNEENLLKIASIYGQEDYSELDADAYDAICELINCVNGLFATQLSDEGIEVILRPPVFYEDVNIKGKNKLYVVNMSLQETSFNIIMTLSNRVSFDMSKKRIM